MFTIEISSQIQKHEALLNALLQKELLAFNVENFKSVLPEYGGVYHIVEKADNIFYSFYIGESSNLQRRIFKNHLMGSRQVSTLKRKLIISKMFSDEDAVKKHLLDRCMIQFIKIENEADRSSFEHFAISILRPKLND